MEEKKRKIWLKETVHNVFFLYLKLTPNVHSKVHFKIFARAATDYNSLVAIGTFNEIV